MNSRDDDAKSGSIFEIMDRMMSEIGRTKKIFILMILTLFILPSGVMIFMTIVAFPILESHEDELIDERIKDAVRDNTITQEEYAALKESLTSNRPVAFIAGANNVAFLISMVWLAVGIRQWIVLSRWEKRYKRFKKSRNDADKKLQDDEV